jgi:hypothetical protein
MRERALPDDFILKVILSKNLIQHDLDVVRGVLIPVIVEVASGLEKARVPFVSPQKTS